jgi:hypothetical protein
MRSTNRRLLVVPSLNSESMPSRQTEQPATASDSSNANPSNPLIALFGSAGGAALVYGIGFLIANALFQKCGVDSFILDDLHYFATGALFLVIFAVASTGSILCAFSALTDPRTRSLRHTVAFFVFGALLGFAWGSPVLLFVWRYVFGDASAPNLYVWLALALVNMILSPLLKNGGFRYTNQLFVVLALAGLALGVFEVYSWSGLVSKLAIWSTLFGVCAIGIAISARQIRLRKHFVLLATASVLLAVVCVVGFGRNLYPLVPKGFGGGSPVKVRMMFESSKSALLQQRGIAFTRRNTLLIAEPVFLLAQREEDYLITSLSLGPALSLCQARIIKKADVVGIEYER